MNNEKYKLRRAPSFRDYVSEIKTSESDETDIKLVISLENFGQQILNATQKIATEKPSKTQLFRKKCNRILNLKVVHIVEIVLRVLNVVALFESNARLRIAGYVSFVGIVMKIVLSALCDFWTVCSSGWFFLDMSGIIVSLLYMVYPMWHPLHTTLKFARILNVFGLLGVSRSSRIFVVAVMNTGGRTLAVAILALVFIFGAAVIGHVLFGALNTYWFGDIWSSCYSIFIVLVGSGWARIFRDVQKEGGMYLHLFFSIVIICGVFVIMNSLNGVSSLSVAKAKKKESKVSQRQERIMRLNQVEHDKVDRLAMKASALSQIQSSETQVKSFKSTKRELLRMRTKLSDLNTLYMLLDKQINELEKRDRL